MSDRTGAGDFHGEDGLGVLYGDDPEDDWREDPGPAEYRRPRSTGRRVRRPVLSALAAAVVLVILLVGGGLLWVQHQINPGGRPGPDVAVTIPKGSSTSRIGSILASAGVIHNGTVFAYYVHLHGYGPLLPGSYELARNSSYDSTIAALRAGPKILEDTLVVPEGFTVHQIAAALQALPRLGLSADKFVAAATDGSVRSPYEPTGTNDLEGLLFPATYQVRQGETEVEVLEAMVGAFDDRAGGLGIDAAATRLGYTPYQVVTVASIVEKEAKLAGDRGNVASTLYNRLQVGMALGADSTQTYYLRLSDPALGLPTAAQDDSPSPYNTRINKGLPPTPIANPGLAALQAATSPPATTYRYFVETSPDGQLSFASSQAGFAQLEARCRAVHLC